MMTLAASLLLAAACSLQPALDLAVFSGGTLIVRRSSLEWDCRGQPLEAAEIGCDRFAGPAVSPDGESVSVWAGSDTLDCILVIEDGGFRILGSWSRAGLPCWDGRGGLWFTAEGQLMRDGCPVGIPLDAHHISVSGDGSRVVFTDDLDRMQVMSTADGQVEMVNDGFRWYAPHFTPLGIVSPSLDGGIRLVADEGTSCELGSGQQPAWWPDRQGILFVRTSDDGHVLLSSDLWLWTAEEGEQRLSDSPEALEAHPHPCGNRVHYVDMATGGVGVLVFAQ